METTLTKKQNKKFSREFTDEDGSLVKAVVTVRYDDQCGNGHNSFAITADLYDRLHWNREPATMLSTGKRRWCGSGGCLHEMVAKRFPELAPFIKWHLCSSDGPMHYIANTVHQAGDKDCWGGRKGEPRSVDYYVQPGQSGLLVEWPEEAHRILGPKVQTFKTREEAQSTADACTGGKVVEWVTQYHKGKERDLDAARSCAVWPDATDEDLTAPGLKERLEARLPALLEAFQADVESLGFTF